MGDRFGRAGHEARALRLALPGHSWAPSRLVFPGSIGAKLHYNWGRILPPEAMPSTRPKLILDEASFEGLLAAAFTIQQYNEREGGIDAALSAELNATLGASAAARKNGGASSTAVEEEIEEQTPTTPAVALCAQCGSPLPPGGVACKSCDAEVFRPGERLQRTWATMWSISQEQGSLPGMNSSLSTPAPERAPDADSGAVKEGTGNLVFHDATNHDATNHDATNHDAAGEDESLRILPVDVTAAAAVSDPHAGQLRLRFRRADLYLGLAVLVALVGAAVADGFGGTDRVAAVGAVSHLHWNRGGTYGAGGGALQRRPEHQGVGRHACRAFTTARAMTSMASRPGATTRPSMTPLDRFEPALRRACVP